MMDARRDLMPPGLDVCLYAFDSHKPPVHKREGFRLPIGARKPPKTEPAIRRLRAMGVSGSGRLGDGTDRVREARLLGRMGR